LRYQYDINPLISAIITQIVDGADIESRYRQY